jgi:toxin ParE1/3/4
MAACFLTRKAKADLKEIGRFTQKKWGVEQRNKYLRTLYKTFDQIAENELVTVDCSEVGEGYRKYYVGRHVVYFKRSADGTIDIIRVLHQSMDVKLQLLH